MKILWLSERFPPDRGGAAVSAARQTRALAPRLTRLDVLRLDATLPAGRVVLERRDGCSLYRVGRAAENDESLQLLQQTALNLIEAHGHDLVHGFYAVHAGFVATLVARLTGRPSVVSLRGNDVERALFHGPRLATLLVTLERADALIGVSHALLSKVRALTGRTAGLQRIANGVDAGVFAPEGPGLDAGQGDAPRPWVAFSGELRLKKGLPVLQELARQMAERGTGSLFWIGDVRAEERGAVEAWRRSAPAAAARVRCVPYQADPARLAALCRVMDLFVFPSLWEGLPNALLEAMASGKTVVASAVGAIPEVVTDGVTGVLVPPARLETLPAIVFDWLARPDEERARLGAAARAHVVAHHAPEAERDEHLALYQALVAGGAWPPLRRV
jgi:glycosyltransferase involved in cell wall biosynthesis